MISRTWISKEKIDMNFNKHRNIFRLAFTLVLTFFTIVLHAQQQDKAALIEKKIREKNFVFMANSLTPMSGRLRILTDPYDVTVKPDSIISFLPYFGRVDIAPVNSRDGGIMFTSTQFSYTSEKGKKDSWNIEIKLKDQRNASTFNFIIYDNGEASLNVLSPYRDAISFRGEIKL